MLVHKVTDKPAEGAATLKFFEWGFANGDKAADELDYITLPDTVKELIRKQWATVKDSAGKPVALK